MKESAQVFFSEIKDWIISDVLKKEEKNDKILEKIRGNPRIFEEALLLRDENDRGVSLLDLAVITDNQVLINNLLYFSSLETHGKRKNSNDFIINREISAKTRPEKYVGTSFQQIGESHYNILHWSALLGNIQMIDKAVSAGADLNRLAKNKYTPLFFAVKGGKLEAAHKLLEYGANVNLGISENSKGLSACLPEAAKDRNLPMVKILLDFGAFEDGKDNQGLTALCYAVINVDFPMVIHLLENKADISVRNEEGHGLIEILYSQHLEDYEEELMLEKEKMRKFLVSEMKKRSSIFGKEDVNSVLKPRKKKDISDQNNAKNIVVLVEDSTISLGETPIDNKMKTRVCKNLFGKEKR